MRFKKRDLTPDQTERLKNKVLDALEYHLGIISYSLEDARISRSTYDDWYKTDDDFRRAVMEINENAIDMVERQLIFNIKDGNQRAIEFYLSKKAKSRGYGSDFSEGLQENEKVLGWVVTPVKSQRIEEENESENE